jgi:hypothetical protein
MERAIGAAVLGLSACGYPRTQFAVRRWGVRGAAVAECACAGLAIRDAWMVASGVPRRLRAVPAAVWAADRVWRAAVVTLFAVHTVRFAIYLGPIRADARRRLGPRLGSGDPRGQRIVRASRGASGGGVPSTRSS